MASTKLSNYAHFFAAFFLTVGGYWIMRPMKVGVFVQLVGLVHEPEVKMMTVAVLVPLLIVYQKIVGLYEPSFVVSVVFGSYSVVFACVAIALHHPTIGMANDVASPDRYLGWFVYVMIESFGSICVPMIWSVLALVVKKEDAGRVYPSITIVCQLGAILGATAATHTAELGFASLFLIQALFCAVSTACVVLALRKAPPAQKSKTVTGVLSGLTTIVSSHYVMGIMVVSTFAEIVSTLMDYQMKMLAKSHYTTGDEFSSFMGLFGQVSNGVSLMFAVCGTSFIIKNLGLKFCLMAFPACCMAILLATFLYSNVWLTFAGMVAMKALGYSLNSPAKEMLYLATSKDVKMKAKSWIDMFGTRGAKAVGAAINTGLRGIPGGIFTYSPAVGAVVVAVWGSVALKLGRQHEELAACTKDVELGDV